jgi:hypothetical protein
MTSRLELGGGSPTARLRAALLVNVTLGCAAARCALDLRVRIPGWAANGSSVRVYRRAERTTDGVRAESPPAAAFYTVPTPHLGWEDGDTVAMRLPMVPRLERLNDERAAYASVASVMLGPLVLAALTNESDVLRADPTRIAEWVVPRPAPCVRSVRRGTAWHVWDQPSNGACDGGGAVQLVAQGGNRNFILEPLSRVALSNYTAYLNVSLDT